MWLIGGLCLSRVEALILDILRDFAPHVEKHKVVQKNFLFRKINGPTKKLVILFLKLKKNREVFSSQKSAQTYYQCQESIITTRFNRSFLLTTALKTRTCVMVLYWFQLIKIESQPNQNYDTL
jgi:hypothetical protein